MSDQFSQVFGTERGDGARVEYPALTPVELAAWKAQVVDERVRLYLVALARTGNQEEASALFGDERELNSVLGWLRKTKLIDGDGAINMDKVIAAGIEKPDPFS